MKNQYFADTRDLFKYDLVLDLLKKTRLNNFTLIPMLTPDEPDYAGGRTNYHRARINTPQSDLKSFLEHCLRTNNRSILMLEDFFKKRSFRNGPRLSVYRKREHFSHSEREGYFRQIPSKLLMNSVILVDPDIGLEVPSMQGKEEKYLRYDEAHTVYDRMDEASILLIFQFIPRVKRNPYLERLCKRLRAWIAQGLPVHYISDNQVAFFALAKNSKSRGELSDHLASYGSHHRLLLGKV